MALIQDSTGLFLEPTSGQYYSPYTAPQSNSFGRYFGDANFIGNNGMGGFMGMQPNYGFSSFANQQPATPEGMMNFDGRSFVPFTGNQAGISAGKRSVVDAMMANRQPFQYNPQSIADLFPMMQNNMQAPMQSGAGRFMGGLLGNMPTPVSSETTQAPSSGAGRFL